MNNANASKVRTRFRKARRAARRNSDRCGAVATEMAVCLPILFMVFLGSIDLIRYNLLRNVVTQATYEAARAGIVRGATRSDVEAVVQSEISRFAPTLNYTLTTNPPVFPTNGTGTLQVTLRCNIRDAGWIISRYIAGDIMEESVELEF